MIAREDRPGDKRLVAYLVGHADASQLRAQLARSLPEYMVPAAYVVLGALPLNANGKLDRKALPAPEGEAYGQRAYTAPQGEVERALAGIWSQLLGVQQVGRDDDFFELGGHSLLAIRLISQIRERFDAELALATLFAQPRLARTGPRRDSGWPRRVGCHHARRPQPSVAAIAGAAAPVVHRRDRCPGQRGVPHPWRAAPAR